VKFSQIFSFFEVIKLKKKKKKKENVRYPKFFFQMMCHNLMWFIILKNVSQFHRIVTHRLGTNFWKKKLECLIFLKKEKLETSVVWRIAAASLRLGRSAEKRNRHLGFFTSTRHRFLHLWSAFSAELFGFTSPKFSFELLPIVTLASIFKTKLQIYIYQRCLWTVA
jgi:hypothetical protein